MRYDYPLNRDSFVCDVGGFKGQWASDIFSRYGCSIAIFEPVYAFYDGIRRRYRDNQRITVFHHGLGAMTREESIAVKLDSSSVYGHSSSHECIKIVDIYEWWKCMNVSQLDLIKINIEGGEYELLERMIETGLARSTHDIQVQFHEINKDSLARMRKIQARLAQTHCLTYQYEFVWENWRRKE